jgi:superfamily I DNA and/or RNA helicase
VEDHGWSVGVVSQSHPVVDNLLDEVVKAGLPVDRIGKRLRPDGSHWVALKDKDYAPFLDAHADGCVIGGTAWDFTNDKRVQPGQLDLLVIDEAGQYSLANTIAVSIAAKRLLLLGDPQQLPQVSQGQHPEPVDESALGWLSDGMTLSPEFGYFLDKTWRMHPALTEPVSRLAYEGRLTSKEPETIERDMRNAVGDEVTPGLRIVPVHHTGNDVSSIEESRAVVEAVTEALTWTWQESAALSPRPMQPEDVLVVAPYNAQVQQIRHDLKTARLDGVRVGTVDKFQGQEAAVVLVSMTASSRDDVPRGMEFLLSPNRLNVAISRGQWLATIVYSPNLTDYLPARPEGLADLGRFLQVVET